MQGVTLNEIERALKHELKGIGKWLRVNRGRGQ